MAALAAMLLLPTVWAAASQHVLLDVEIERPLDPAHFKFSV